MQFPCLFGQLVALHVCHWTGMVVFDVRFIIHNKTLWHTSYIIEISDQNNRNECYGWGWSSSVGNHPALDASHRPVVGCHYFCKVCAYLPSCRASLPLGHYQIILLGDRHVCEQLDRNHNMTVEWLIVEFTIGCDSDTVTIAPPCHVIDVSLNCELKS